MINNTTTLDQAVERMWEHIADADYASSPDAKRAALSAGMTDIEAQILAHPHNANLYYYMALLWYHWPDRTNEARGRTHSYLKLTLDIDPEHARARIYLGFQQFDESRFEDALTTLEHSNAESLGPPSSAWQLLKVAELIICCKLRLNWQNVTLGELEKLTADYEAYKKDTTPPAPVELARTAIALCANVQEPEFLEIVRKIIHLVKQVEGPEGGALHRELPQLEACSHAALWLTEDDEGADPG